MGSEGWVRKCDFKREMEAAFISYLLLTRILISAALAFMNPNPRNFYQRPRHLRRISATRMHTSGALASLEALLAVFVDINAVK